MKNLKYFVFANLVLSSLTLSIFDCQALGETPEKIEAVNRIQQYFRKERIRKGVLLKYGYDPYEVSTHNMQRLCGELKRLTPEERQVVGLIVDNFTISHSTADKVLWKIFRSDSVLKSPRQRKREGMQVVGQHTGRDSNTDDSVFFTGGIGETAPVKFLGSRCLVPGCDGLD